MQRACHRCGAQVDDHVPFCPSCGAPQIKVSTQESSSAAPDLPVTQPLEPGTPGSIHPPAIKIPMAAAGALQWKRFLRISLPLAFLSGLATAFRPPLGFLFLLISIFIATSLYRRKQPAVETQ